MKEMVFHSKREAADAACAVAAQASAERGRAVLLVPTYDETVRMKHVLADCGLGYGIDVETPASWITDLWEMLGDGRAIATSTQTALFVRLALKQYRSACVEAGKPSQLEQTAGIERLIRNVLEAAPGQVVAADKNPDLFGLTPAQQAAVHVRAQARRLMAQAGLIVRARACDYLSETNFINDLVVVVLDCDTLLAEKGLLAKTRSTVISVDAETAVYDERAPELNELAEKLYRPDFEHPILPTGAVRFAYPAGEYASNQLLADEVERVIDGARGAAKLRIGVTAADPLRLFDEVAPRLLALGASVSATGMVGFGDVPFGRAWSALLEYVLDEKNVHFAGDFALSAFSLLDLRGAFAADAALRSWRGETVSEGLDDIKQQTNENWQEFIVAIERQDFIAALDAQMRWVQSRMGWTEAFRTQQANAIMAAKEVHQAAAALGLEPLDALNVLQETMLPFETCVKPAENEPRAEITLGSMAQLAGHEPCSFDAVVITHLDVNRYPLKDEESATDLLLQSLDSWEQPRRVEKLRLRFARCIALARGKVVLHRALNNEEAGELRPSALVEELVDCYRCDPRNTKEVDKLTGLPESLVRYCRTSGEGDLSRLLEAEGLRAGAAESVQLSPLGQLSPKAAAMVMPVSLSASALECYVACPHKWFVGKRLKLEGVDAELGPIARGNCAHAVLECVHKGLVDQGYRHVTRDNLAACKNMARQAFDAYVENQKVKRSPVDPNAYYPLTQMERLDSARFREQLCDYLEWEVDLLPTFSLHSQEFKFGFDGDVTEYAGVRVSGSIDRIDVDGAGNAVIIDYKSSAKLEHCRFNKNTLEILERMKEEAGSDDVFVLPESIQTLMYAQIVRRKLGLNPVGAFYVGYGKTHGVAGAYEHVALRAEVDLPGIDVDKCAVTGFLSLLDRTEDEIIRRIERLKAGDVRPDPYTKNACQHCLALECAFRDSLGVKGGN